MKYFEFGVLASCLAIAMTSCAPRVVERIVEVPARPMPQQTVPQQTVQSARPTAEQAKYMSVADQLADARRRAAVEKAAQLEKLGWQLDDPARTLELAILEHMAEKIENKNLREIVGNAENCSTINLCQATARENAIVAYVENISTKIKGRGAGMLSSKQTSKTPADIEQTFKGFIKTFEAEVGQSMRLSYGIFRSSLDKQGTKEYRIVYLIDGSVLESAARNALKSSVEEAKRGAEFVKTIDEMVKAGDLDPEKQNQ